MPASAALSVQLDMSWPDFPVPLREAAGARIGQALYAGLGSAGAAWFRLDLLQRDAGWQRMADFPGAVPSGAAHAATGTALYIFGGCLAADGEHAARQSDAIWRYDSIKDSWSELGVTLPAGLLGAAAVASDAGTILLFGGYNRQQFDAFCSAQAQAGDEVQRAALLRAYMNRPITAFDWNRQVLRFDTASASMHNTGATPFLPTCGAAAMLADGRIVLAGGELKPGLRTPLVWRSSDLADMHDGDAHRLTWSAQRLPDTGDGVQHSAQEGVAAAFGGVCGGVALLAGGTNFPGAAHNYEHQQWHAHAGLVKTWRRELYRHDGRQWACIGALPAGRAHGLAFSVGSALLLVGGDTDGGVPIRQTWALTLSNAAARDTVSIPASY